MASDEGSEKTGTQRTLQTHVDIVPERGEARGVDGGADSAERTGIKTWAPQKEGEGEWGDDCSCVKHECKTDSRQPDTMQIDTSRSSPVILCLVLGPRFVFDHGFW